MSKAGRWGLVALAVAVAVAAFLIARPGDDDSGSEQAAGTATETVTAPTATAPSAPEPPPDGPDPTTIELTGNAVDEVVDIAVAKGDEVRLLVRSDAPDEIHVHGYDVSRDAAPGSPARFAFPATIEGVFEIESHEAEHAGKDALIARLVVEPS
jgi:FtsP/CotA-like multicopper oxidase with cupredoxin domain